MRKVDAAGTITTVAGGGSGRMRDREMAGAASDAPLPYPSGLAVTPNGGIVVAEADFKTVVTIAAPLPGASSGDLLIPSEDGDELYRFSAAGRHLDTRDTLTGAVVESFAYDAAGRLLSAVDGDGLATTLERDADGAVRAIVGPDGHRTGVTSGPGGRLDALRDPAGATTAFTYSASGLLTALQGPSGTAEFDYDPLGRLLSDDDTGDGATTLQRTAAGAPARYG